MFRASAYNIATYDAHRGRKGFFMAQRKCSGLMGSRFRSQGLGPMRLKLEGLIVLGFRLKKFQIQPNLQFPMIPDK